jgi:hypothetical protein
MDSDLRRNDFSGLVMPFVIPVKTVTGILVMPLQNGIHCKSKDKVLHVCTVDSDLRRNDS